MARLKEEPRLDVLHEIMGALGGIGPPAIEPLIKMLKQGDARSLMGISGALFRIGEQAAAAVAVAVLRDDNETVRDIGLQILLQMRDKAAPAVPALVALLDEVDEERRTHIMVSLLLCGRAALQAAPALVQRLATGDENMAWWAAQVLRKFGTDAVPYLEAGKSAADSVGRERIDRLLGEFKPAAAAGFERLAQWKCDQHLAVFVVWGELLEANSPCSMRNVAALLRSGAAYEDYGYKIGRSEGTFRNALKSLERKQKSRLISRKEGGQIVRLNEAGRELLARAREYLRWRRGPRDDSANQLSS